MGGWVDSVPMFVVSGQIKFETSIKSVPLLRLRQLGDQEFNITDCAACMTKYCVMVTEPEEILYHLEKAWYLMNDRRPGPVWLDIPLNVQGARIETAGLKRFDPAEIRADTLDTFTPERARALLKKIKNAKSPVVFAGTAIRNAGRADKFLTLCERLKVPVVTAWNAHDSIYDAHPLFCGRPGTVGTRAGNFVVQNADLLLVIGSQLNIRQISYNWTSFARRAELIVVDIDKNELSKPTLRVDDPVNCDLRDFIDVCLSVTDAGGNDCAGTHTEWLHWAKGIFYKYHDEKVSSPAGVMNPYLFIREFSERLDADDMIVCSNGSSCVIPFQTFRLKKGQRMFTNSGCTSMGYGLPAAIGSAAACGDKRIICFEGDGSVQMNIQEMATLSCNAFNVKLAVFNNNGYHSMRQTQLNLFKGRDLCGVSAGNGLMFPDLSLLARAYGIEYIAVRSLDDMDGLMEGIAGKGPQVVELFVDPKQSFAPKLSSRVLDDGTIVSPDIDDMFPFMDRDEYEKIKFGG
jgi:acetolactate synthase-1/2/3 large subunit